MTWRCWREHFEHNQHRPLPPLPRSSQLPADRAARLARSLARFQLGETGEGRVARRIFHVALPGIDGDYRHALGLFVKEEGRHARILAGMVRALGGTLVAETWTRGLFVRARGLLGRGALGVRFKLLVLLAAEVIGAGFYDALAAGLPRGGLRAALEEIRDDERAHLRFHRDFFRAQAPSGWRRGLFLLGWSAVGPAAALAVLCDHRRTLRALGISPLDTARALAGLLRDAGRLEAGRPDRLAGAGAA